MLFPGSCFRVESAGGEGNRAALGQGSDEMLYIAVYCTSWYAMIALAESPPTRMFSGSNPRSRKYRYSARPSIKAAEIGFPILRGGPAARRYFNANSRLHIGMYSNNLLQMAVVTLKEGAALPV